jgi:hypothetical protein
LGGLASYDPEPRRLFRAGLEGDVVAQRAYSPSGTMKSRASGR